MYPIVVGSLGRLVGGGAEGAVTAAYVVHWLAAIGGGAALLTWMAIRGWLRLVAAFVFPISMLGSSVAWHGRVEPLAILIVAAGVLAWRLPSPWRDVVVGAALPVLIFTTPACGALGLFVVGIAYLLDRRSRLRDIAACAAGSVAATIAAVAVFPYPIRDWVGGVIRHSRINLSLTAGQGFVQTWLKAPESPLLILTFGTLLLAAAVLVVDLARRQTRPRQMAVAVLSGVFLVGLARLAFVKTEASYNAVVWLPLAGAMAVASVRSTRPLLFCVGVLALPALGRSIRRHSRRTVQAGCRSVRRGPGRTAPSGRRRIHGVSGALARVRGARSSHLLCSRHDQAISHRARNENGSNGSTNASRPFARHEPLPARRDVVRYSHCPHRRRMGVRRV